ncbi:MAG TPA: tetratricopeptide repeat protein [Candidatus Kapabacteria bacterium]|nr:tetratricopeptide repeat protein [Candidatus Kapabacteria bacterium]
MKKIQQTVLLALIATFALEFAGCGAADVQSAKLYRQRRDYISADRMLKQAITEDPTGDEAWYLYAMNLNDLKEYETIANIIDTAMLYSVTHRSELQQLKHNTWVELYNGGLGAYNANPDSKEAQQAAIGYLESARKLEPDQPETYALLGQVYYSAGDTAKGLENYLTEINQLSPSYNQGIAMGLMLHLPPDAVERAIGGAPARQQFVSLGGSDSALVYVYPSKQSYVYFERADKPPFAWQLTGWRVTSSDVEGMQPLRVSTEAYALAANNYYQKGLADEAHGDKNAANDQFQKAIPLLMTLQQIDPSDEFASQAIPDIYTRMERTDKAKQEYERILAQHPSKAMYISYGTLLMKSNDYQGAITAYQKALALAPADEAALYDIAAAYKNRAVAEQKDKNPDYKTDLQQSTNYFEQLHAIDKNDPKTLMNLVENYVILNQKDKVIALVGDIEALKSTDQANSHEYWDVLARAYSFANRPKDAEAAYKKSDELKQQGH